MEQVQDVDISKLSFLKKSKELMQEDNTKKTNNNNGNNRDLNVKQNNVEPNHNNHYEDRVMNSKLSGKVKEAMLNNRIEPQKMVESSQKNYSMEDVNNYGSQREEINENNVPTQNSNIGKDEIKSIIKEVLGEMMVKTISENTIKKTIKTLMNEGVIPKRKRK